MGSGSPSDAPSQADRAAPEQRPSKAARIARRTAVGAALVGALALLFTSIYRSEDGTVVFIASCALMLLGAIELGRMGRFASRGVALPLGVAAVGQFAALGLAGDVAAEGASGRIALDLARPVVLALGTWGLLALAPVKAQRWIALAFALFAVVMAGDGRASASQWVFWSVAGLTLVFALGKALDERERRVELALLAGLAAWVVFPLPALWEIWRAWHADGLLALVLLSKIGDIFGYYVGSAIGRRRPFPRTSPGKTVAGCVASLAAGMLSGGVLVLVGLLPERPLGIAGGLLAGALINLASQAGDLLESRAKRWAGVKDSGTWFGPSGGVLDLVDSLLLSVPMALVSWPFLFETP